MLYFPPSSACVYCAQITLQVSYQERLELEYSRLSFLVMSDLWLDHRRTLDGLRKVFEGCVENDFIPLIFILCGNFTSGSLDLTAGAGLSKYQGK